MALVHGSGLVGGPGIHVAAAVTGELASGRVCCLHTRPPRSPGSRPCSRSLRPVLVDVFLFARRSPLGSTHCCPSTLGTRGAGRWPCRPPLTLRAAGVPHTGTHGSSRGRQGAQSSRGPAGRGPGPRDGGASAPRCFMFQPPRVRLGWEAGVGGCGCLTPRRRPLRGGCVSGTAGWCSVSPWRSWGRWGRRAAVLPLEEGQVHVSHG